MNTFLMLASHIRRHGKRVKEEKKPYAQNDCYLFVSTVKQPTAYTINNSHRCSCMCMR